MPFERPQHSILEIYVWIFSLGLTIQQKGEICWWGTVNFVTFSTERY